MTPCRLGIYMKENTLIHYLGCLLLFFSSGALAQNSQLQYEQTTTIAAQEYPDITLDQSKLVLISALDFERLRINLPKLYTEVYAKTGITITLHSTFAEEVPPLIHFMQATAQRPHAMIFAQDQLYSFSEMLLDLSDLERAEPSLTLAQQKNFLQLNQGFFLALYFNKKLIDNPASDFSMFAKNSLAVNFGTAFTTQLFWHHSGLIKRDGSINKHNLEGALTDALFMYQEFFTQSIIPASCSTNTCINALFLNQNIPYAIDGTWMHETFTDALGDNLGFSILPELDNVPSLALRIPHVLGVLSELSPEQTKALALFSRLIIQESTAFQNGLLANTKQTIALDKISYVVKDYQVLGCIFEKLNPHMAQLNTLATKKQIQALVKNMGIGKCYE